MVGSVVRSCQDVVFFAVVDSPVGRVPPAAFFAAGEEHGFREGDDRDDPVQYPVEQRIPDDGEIDAEQAAVVFAFHEEADGELQQAGRAQYQSGIGEREDMFCRRVRQVDEQFDDGYDGQQQECIAPCDAQYVFDENAPETAGFPAEKVMAVIFEGFPSPDCPAQALFEKTAECFGHEDPAQGVRFEADVPVLDLQSPADVDVFGERQFVPVADAVQCAAAVGADDAGDGEDAAVYPLCAFEQSDDGGKFAYLDAPQQRAAGADPRVAGYGADTRVVDEVAHDPGDGVVIQYGVAVDADQKFPFCSQRAGLEGDGLALVGGELHDPHARDGFRHGFKLLAGIVGAAVVDGEDFVVWVMQVGQRGEGFDDVGRFVVARHQYGYEGVFGQLRRNGVVLPSFVSVVVQQCPCHPEIRHEQWIKEGEIEQQFEQGVKHFYLFSVSSATCRKIRGDDTDVRMSDDGVVRIVAEVVCFVFEQLLHLLHHDFVGHRSQMSRTPVLGLQFKDGSAQSERMLRDFVDEVLHPLFGVIRSAFHVGHGFHTGIVVGGQEIVKVLRHPFFCLWREDHRRIHVAGREDRRMPFFDGGLQFLREIDQRPALCTGEGVHEFRILADLFRVVWQADASQPGFSGRADVFEVADDAVVMEDDAHDRGVCRQVFVDFVDDAAVVCVERCQTGVKDFFVRRDRFDDRTVFQIEAQYRQPCIDFAFVSRGELPGDVVEEVRAHGQMAVREIQFVGGTVAVRVCECLKVDDVGAGCLDAVEQQRGVFLALYRVFVIDHVQIDVHDALDGQIGDRQVCHGVAAAVIGAASHDACFDFSHHSRKIDFFVHHESRDGRPVGKERQRGGQRVARFLCGLYADLVVASVWPDGDERTMSGLVVDDVGRFFPVVVNSLFEGFDGFVLAGFGVIQSVCAGGQFDALRVALVSAVQVVGVRCQFDDAGIGHFADLLPVQECRTRKTGSAAVIDEFAFRGFQPARFKRQERGVAVGFEHRIDDFIEAAVSVVERKQYGFRRQRLAGFLCLEDVLDADDMVAVFFQPVEVGFQLFYRDRGGIVEGTVSQFRNDIVVAQGDERRCRRFGVCRGGSGCKGAQCEQKAECESFSGSQYASDHCEKFHVVSRLDLNIVSGSAVSGQCFRRHVEMMAVDGMVVCPEGQMHKIRSL